MKEVKIRYKKLSDRQKDSIEILIKWLYHLNMLNKSDNKFNLWPMYNHLKSLKNPDYFITAYDMKNLRELWDTYAEYMKQSKNDAR